MVHQCEGAVKAPPVVNLKREENQQVDLDEKKGRSRLVVVVGLVSCSIIILTTVFVVLLTIILSSCHRTIDPLINY